MPRRSASRCSARIRASCAAIRHSNASSGGGPTRSPGAPSASSRPIGVTRAISWRGCVEERRSPTSKPASCAPLLDGSPARFVATIQDISDYKRTDEALRRSEAYLAEAQRLTHTGSWAQSMTTGEATHSSEEHDRLFGFEPEGGLPSAEEFRQRIHPQDRARSSEIYQRAIRERRGVDQTFRTLLPDGTLRYIQIV